MFLKYVKPKEGGGREEFCYNTKLQAHMRSKELDAYCTSSKFSLIRILMNNLKPYLQQFLQ